MKILANKIGVIRFIKAIACCTLILTGYASIHGDTLGDDVINEDQLFETVEPVEPAASSPFLTTLFDKESTQFTGQLYSRSISTFYRHSDAKDASLSSYSQANIFMDTRLKKGTKIYLNLELSQLSSSNSTVSNGTYATIRELFLDFNINRNVYVRTGKQVLQWGPSYFWNPTDLINTESHNFFELNRYRDGAYGTRIQLPIGTDRNMYFFIGQQNASKLEELSLAAKYEFLFGNSEIGLSTWQKPSQVSVYGLDFSTRLLGLDIKGESAFSYGENTPRIVLNNGATQNRLIRGEWTNKTSLTFQKNWDWELPERIASIAEVFYNSHGYDHATLSNNDVRTALVDQYLYRPNMNSRWYSALFVTISKFPLTDSNLNINTISNLTDLSHISGLWWTYSPIDHLSFNTAIYTYWGQENGEYTYANNSISLEASATVDF